MKKRALPILLLSVLLMLVFLAVPAGASKANSVTLSYEPGAAEFDFYLIARFDEEQGLTLAEPFDSYTGYPSILEGLSLYAPEDLRILSSTLEALILRDGVAPKYSESTDSEGYLRLENVEKGVYLVLGENTTRDSFVYSPSPIFVSVPNRYSEDAPWQYDVTVEHSKYEKEELCNRPTEYKVMKIWQDEGAKKLRPEKIEVRLLCDGKVYDTVTLSAENNWSHIWKDLPREHSWTAVEKKVPDGYSMTVEKDKALFVIKNTPDTPPPPPEELPQTGQLKWPAPLMLVLGAICFTTGWLRRKYL